MHTECAQAHGPAGLAGPPPASPPPPARLAAAGWRPRPPPWRARAPPISDGRLPSTSPAPPARPAVARCEAFRGMFNSAFREGSKESREVPIHEVTYAAFRCMLGYIYGGAVRVPEELAVELLGLADRYLLDGLKQLCGFTLAKMIGTDTVARIIQAADRWDTENGELKMSCMDFILSNYQAVVSHPVFEELASSPHLLLEISRAAARIVPPHGFDDAAGCSSSSGWRPAKRPRKA